MKDAMGLGNFSAQPRSTRKKHKKNKVFKTTLLVTLALIGLTVAIGLLTPAFYIREITVTGTGLLTPEKVLDASGLTVGTNIFTFRTDTVTNNISSLSFVKEVSVSRAFPDKVSIVISECKPIAQILCGESLYIIVDETGKILDTTSERSKYGVPAIEGVWVEQFQVGNIVETTDPDQVSLLLTISEELFSQEMSDSVDKLSISRGDIFLHFQSGIKADIGDGSNYTYKIKFLKEVMAEIPAEKAGTIEFIDEYKAVFKEYE